MARKPLRRDHRDDSICGPAAFAALGLMVYGFVLAVWALALVVA